MRISPQRFFLLVAFCFGMIFIFIVPPFQVPDEVSHFLRANHIASGHLMGEKTSNRLGGELPKSLLEISTPFRPLRYNYQAKTSIDSIQKAWNVPLRKQDCEFIDFANVGYYSPTAYIPQAIAASCAKLFNFNPLNTFYLIRIGCFFFWILLVFQAIKVIPFHKWTFCFLALLPSSLFLHASMNADAVSNAIAFLLIAKILRLAFDQSARTGKETYVLLLILSIFLTINKVVYAPIIALALLIPKAKFQSQSNWFVWIFSLVGINILVLGAWYLKTKAMFIPYEHYHTVFRETQQLNVGVNPPAQMEFIFGQPIEFLKIMLSSFWDSKMATLAHYFGKFGWEKNYLPAGMIALLCVGILGSSVMESERTNSLKKGQRTYLIFLATAMILFFSMVIYMQWSPPKSEVIYALSGRYFIPIFPLFFLAFRNKQFQNWWPKMKIATMCLLILGNSWGIIAVLQRYWWI